MHTTCKKQHFTNSCITLKWFQTFFPRPRVHVYISNFVAHFPNFQLMIRNSWIIVSFYLQNLRFDMRIYHDWIKYKTDLSIHFKSPFLENKHLRQLIPSHWTKMTIYMALLLMTTEYRLIDIARTFRVPFDIIVAAADFLIRGNVIIISYSGLYSSLFSSIMISCIGYETDKYNAVQ